MSALFDDAERFDSLIVVGDTVRRVKDATEEHVGPGTYSPSMANSEDFGHIGVSTSRRSNMDPPMSMTSTEHQRYATGSVVRDGIWFHSSPSAAMKAGPGPGEYSPAIMSGTYERGRTAKPSSGMVGRQAWDLRGSAGGAPLSNFRDGFSVSASMGTTPRMVDFSQVSLHGGVLLLRGPNDGHRSNGIGPGEYDGICNGQDPMTRRSYNMRAQTSQARRERSLSFSGTSSTVRAFLSLSAASARSAEKDKAAAATGRPDLHLLGGMGRRPSPERGSRCMSPASAMLSSMRSRAGMAATAGGRNTATFGMRSGGASSRSLSPRRNRSRSGFPIRGIGGGRHGSGNSNGLPPSSLGHGPGSYQHQHQQRCRQQQRESREARSLSPRGSGGGGGVGAGTSTERGRRGGGGNGRSGTASLSPRAVADSARRHQLTGGAGSSALGAPPSSSRNRYRTTTGDNDSMTSAAGGSGGFGGDAPYTFDYFGLAGQKGAWRGLEEIEAARAEVGIGVPIKDTANKTNGDAQEGTTKEGRGGGDGAKGVPAGTGGGGGSGVNGGALGGGGPGSLLPEGAPAKGVCSPPKETRDDLHTYFDAVISHTNVALGSTGSSNLPPPPSPRALRPGSA